MVSALSTVAAAAVLAGATGEGGNAASVFESPVLPHLGEVIVGTICFLVILFLAYRYAVPRLEAMLSARRAQIEGGIEKAQQAQAEADAAREEYQAQLATARADAGRLREEARTEGAQILAEMRAQAQAEAARITESAQRQVQAERQQAMTSLRADVGGLATTLAERIVGESLTDSARQSRVIDRFLAEIEEADPSDARTPVGAAVGGGTGGASGAGRAAGAGGDDVGPVQHAVDVAKRLLSGLTHFGDDEPDAPSPPPGASPTGGSTRMPRAPRDPGGSTP